MKIEGPEKWIMEETAVARLVKICPDERDQDPGDEGTGKFP
jgi:hypothetical protein